ncbi:uncharacterized protein BO88DRAFT_468982 [Aspergillus vadensis CBS 113365]|uniref:Major facilitator superfamily (MFS) profile domain-containing protein n=1 Tax=Aspergillus vadensis (strain CBS 113365 / IMI 142717 / IBT 24658) TaxID=1448311 RepID=A0A319BTZ5_ASPVC|nr:hypothetical protein BO88DRAFT_468982 [Aspergillus vadensis CBS 113365]PYH66598.1 hypothetical protein BO88DRAFT_468982 [Aspergillus vadensis CBS 113365]
MPTIVHDLDSSSAYVWIANAYFLTSTAFQPLYGQSANIFGRRSLIILSVVLFAIGFAVSGSARSTNVLIVGRTIQGVGGGGINVRRESKTEMHNALASSALCISVLDSLLFAF